MTDRTICVACCLLAGTCVSTIGCNPKAPSSSQGVAEASTGGRNLPSLTVTAAFAEGGGIPAANACGAPRKDDCDFGVAPRLTWTTGPAKTASYGIVMCDPDGRDWLHWVVVGIPPSVHELAEGASGHCRAQLPAGAKEGKNEFGQTGYGGPCPPAGSGVHHYQFTVYALSSPTIELPSTSVCADHRAALESAAIARGTLTGTYRIDR